LDRDSEALQKEWCSVVALSSRDAARRERSGSHWGPSPVAAVRSYDVASSLGVYETRGSPFAANRSASFHPTLLTSGGTKFGSMSDKTSATSQTLEMSPLRTRLCFESL